MGTTFNFHSDSSSHGTGFKLCMDITEPPTKAPTGPPTKPPTLSPTKAPTLSPTKAPTVSPTKEPTKYSPWSILSGSAHCKLEISADGHCVSDTSGDYGALEDCSFTFTGSHTLTASEWGIEGYGCKYDYLEVDGNKYCGGSGSSDALPSSGLAVSGVTTFNFHSDSASHGTGFKLCMDITEPPTKAPTGPPTKPPSLSPTKAPTVSPTKAPTV